MTMSRRSVAVVVFMISILLVALSCGDEMLYSDVSEDNFDDKILDRINDYRESEDLERLAYSGDLWRLAKDHAEDMNDRDELDHDGFDDRMERSRSDYCVENVAAGGTTSKEVFEMWRDSAGHNENMLDSVIRRAAVAHKGAYSVFFSCD